MGTTVRPAVACGSEGFLLYLLLSSPIFSPFSYLLKSVEGMDGEFTEGSKLEKEKRANV